MAKYPKLDQGTIEAIVNKLGGMAGVERFLRGELTVFELLPNWRKQDGVIYFPVISDGATGPQWVERLHQKSIRMGASARDILHSPDFQPTSGMITEIAVIGGQFFQRKLHTLRAINTNAHSRLALINPNIEVACLIREKFSDDSIKAMGIMRIVVMHELTRNSTDCLCDLTVSWEGNGNWLSTTNEKIQLESEYMHTYGFAFATAQIRLGS